MEQRRGEFQERPVGEAVQPQAGEVARQERSEEYLQMKEWIRQVQSDADYARARAEQTENNIEELRLELQARRRKDSGKGWLLAFVLLILLGAIAYAYHSLAGQNSVLSQIPGLQKAFDAVGQRLNGTEEQLRSWAANWGTLSDRVNKLETATSANLRTAKEFATVQSSKVQQQLQDEMDNRSRSTDAKLQELTNSQESDRSQLAALQQQVGDVQTQASQQLISAQEKNAQEFGAVHEQLDQNRSGLDAVVRNLDRQRVDFEVSRNQSRELVPGLAFTVLKTDVAHQQVDGYLHLIPEGRMLWVHAQGIEQPMLFHDKDDKRNYEVVFTRVNQDTAVGYVLTPRWPAAELPAVGDTRGGQPTTAAIR